MLAGVSPGLALSMRLDAELRPILESPTGLSTAGWPYLQEYAFVRLRDWVPHILDHGPRVLEAVARLVLEDPELSQAGRVVRQVVRTAAITAPADLWLLRHVIDTLKRNGVLARLAEGPVEADSELHIDLRFLLARGYLVRSGEGYRLAEHAHARGLLALPLLEGPAHRVPAWEAALAGGPAPAFPELVQSPRQPGLWCATAEEIQRGHALVPLVLALRRSPVEELPPAAERLLEACGAVGELRERVLNRGPGPFGIIEAYHPYLAALPRILNEGRGSVHLERGANVAASQDANRRSFLAANDALDQFCEGTGFRYQVFIEHAVGRGEATRQRWERGPKDLITFGADLEDAAIDAALQEQAAGRLPPDMRFIRHADIGRPERVVDALTSAGVPTEGAVMVVGNGFHEVRGQSDEGIVRVFEGDERAGILLLFTEESALSVDDLLHTAWNTYHAGFKYVHERSGQGLRPASPAPPSALNEPLPASWSECASRAGYVRVSAYSSRSRTIYPYTPASGHNPAISVNHFFVPARVASRLGLRGGSGDAPGARCVRPGPG